MNRKHWRVQWIKCNDDSNEQFRTMASRQVLCVCVRVCRCRCHFHFPHNPSVVCQRRKTMEMHRKKYKSYIEGKLCRVQASCSFDFRLFGSNGMPCVSAVVLVDLRKVYRRICLRAGKTIVINHKWKIVKCFVHEINKFLNVSWFASMFSFTWRNSNRKCRRTTWKLFSGH